MQLLGHCFKGCTVLVFIKICTAKKVFKVRCLALLSLTPLMRLGGFGCRPGQSPALCTAGPRETTHLCLSCGTTQMIKQKPLLHWGRHHLCTHHKDDEGRGDDLCFGEEMPEPGPWLCFCNTRKCEGGLVSLCTTHLASPTKSAAESGAEACFSVHSSGACRYLQVCRSELVLGKKEQWTLDGRRAIPCPASSGRAQHSSWLSNPRQLLCEKEAGKKGELPFLKCLL